MSDDKFPTWKDMPKPHPILKLSWEDVYDKARDAAQKKFRRDPARNEVDAIFQTIKSHGMDCASDTFWDTVQTHVNNFYDRLDK